MDFIDHVVLGDGELPLLALCQGEPHSPNCVTRTAEGAPTRLPLAYVQGTKNSEDIYIRLLRAVRSGERGSRRSCLVAARPRAAGRDDRFDGVEFLRADTHRGWGIASMARTAAR